MVSSKLNYLSRVPPQNSIALGLSVSLQDFVCVYVGAEIIVSNMV